MALYTRTEAVYAEHDGMQVPLTEGMLADAIVERVGVEALRGPKGDSGAQGPRGDQGDIGRDGAAGPAGPTGPAGRNASALIVGANHVKWSGNEAGARAIGLVDDRLGYDYGTDTAAAAIAGIRDVLAAGFNVLVVLDTPDATALSAVSVSGYARWCADVVAGVGPTAAVAWELINEPDLKGGGSAEPAAYAALWEAAAAAIGALGAHSPLLFYYNGDYSSDGGRTWSQVVSGRGWLADALAARPALKTLIEGFSSHPYGPIPPNADPADQDQSYGGSGGWLRLARGHDVAVSLGIDVPWWVTEAGARSTDAGVGEHGQAAYAARYLADAKNWPWLRGIWWFQFSDLGFPGYGLVTDNTTGYTPKRALYAWVPRSQWADPKLTKVWRSSHTFAVAGAVATATLPGMPVAVAAGQAVRLAGVRARVRSGTSASFRVQVNGADVTGFGTGAAPLVADTTLRATTPTAATLREGDEITVVVSAVSGSPSDLSVGVILEHTV